jgi:hypothetical protein
MAHLELDHLYRETHDWDGSVAFWEALGFGFTDQWGEAPHRAGRLVGGAAEVVLAETDVNQDPLATPFLATRSLDDLAAATGTPIERTHWGTTMITLTDPDGRTYHIEQEESA